MRKIYKKLMLLLDARQKKQMVGIVFMMLIGGLLETFGIALIVPLMEAISKPEDLHKSRKFRVLCDLLNLDVYDLSSSDLIKLTAVIMFSIMVIIVIKNIFLFFMNKVQLRFVYTNQFATSRRMMINFMQRPYEYYLNADTSVIQRNITSDVNNMYGLILSSLQLISEIIVFVSLVIYLLMEDAKMTVSLASLLVAMLLIIKWSGQSGLLQRTF